MKNHHTQTDPMPPPPPAAKREEVQKLRSSIRAARGILVFWQRLLLPQDSSAEISDLKEIQQLEHRCFLSHINLLPMWNYRTKTNCSAGGGPLSPRRTTPRCCRSSRR